MKTSVVALTLLLLSAATTALAQNQIYINQITTGGNTTLVQVGSLNKIGTSAAAQSDITGDNIVFEMRQIGNSNDTKFSIASANNLKLLTVATGNSNNQQYYFSGASNNANILLNGNSNKFLLNGDTSVDHTSSTDTTKATFTNSDLIFNVQGNSNDLRFGISSGKYNYLDFSITGDSNNIKSTQIGNPGGAAAKTGHEQTVVLTGSGNDIMIYQAGLEKQTLNYTLTGSTNNVQIVQTTAGYAPVMTTTGTNGPTGPSQTTNSITPPGN
jgi:hypothetical protein